MLNKTFKLGVVCPVSHDGTSLMRGVGPLAAMSREDRKLELCFPKATPDGGLYLGWDWLAALDGLFLQRPFLPVHVSAAQTAKAHGLPVWVDFDDDNSSVPASNEYRRHFDNETQAQVMARSWALADVVTVTTTDLQERLLQNSFGQGVDPVIRRQCDAGKIRVLPNALHWPVRSGPRTQRVVWRGGKSHDADLMAFLPAIREVSRLPQFAKWEWHFMGDMSAYVQHAITEAIPAENLRIGFGDFPHQYIAALGLLCPWLVIVPLEDNAFNRCKSPLAWIEASASGATTLAPAWPAWDLPGVQRYDGRESFKTQLLEELKKFDGSLRATGLAQVSREFIASHLTLAKVNEQRWEIIKSFLRQD